MMPAASTTCDDGNCFCLGDLCATEEVTLEAENFLFSKYVSPLLIFLVDNRF
jgi:hypothetical protein